MYIKTEERQTLARSVFRTINRMGICGLMTELKSE